MIIYIKLSFYVTNSIALLLINYATLTNTKGVTKLLIAHLSHNILYQYITRLTHTID